MQTDTPETPAADSAGKKKPNPTRATPIGRDISDAKLRALKPAEKAYRQAVGGGLYLEVMPSGSKLWRWKYRLDGRENRFAIGKYPRISLVQARQAVEQARQLVQDGRHPSLQKKIAGLEAAHGRLHTLEDVAKEWLGLKTWEDITKKRRLNMLERVVFPKLGALPIRQVTPPIILDVLKIAAEKNGISVMAEAKRTLFGIFEFAQETFRVDTNPVHRWRDALPKNKTQHKAPLSKADIGQLLRDLDTHGGSYQIQAAFLLMWLTLARPSEVVEAQWSEFDLDLAIWRIPAERMKKRREHVVPLPQQAVSLLRGMQTVTGHRQHVFPHRDNRHKPMVVASFRQMLHVLGWSGKFSPHAARTTGSTRLNEMGFPPDWIERQATPIIPSHLLKRYQVEDVGDTRFRACARLLQSMWREDQQLPVGSHQQTNEYDRCLGSRIDRASGSFGRNFLTTKIARLAKYETVYREPGAMIEEERLWHNLLSSQPLCFNLFGDMKLDLSMATRFWSSLFPDHMAKVEAIYFEHSPGRGDEAFIADHTAFDVLIAGQNRKGQSSFIAIEVKYSEAMNEPAATLRPRYEAVAECSGLFKEPDHPALRSAPIQQLWREHMLSQTMLDNGLYESGLFLVVHPAKNEDCSAAVASYKQHLQEPSGSTPAFAAVTLEDCVQGLRDIGEAELADALFARYLDFDRIEAAIFGEEVQPT